VPTRPLLQGCLAAHSMASKKSRDSEGDQGSVLPGDFPEPRPSTRRATYPRGTHHSGFTVSQFMVLVGLFLQVRGRHQSLSFW